jgi:hypothetical protein
MKVDFPLTLSLTMKRTHVPIRSQQRLEEFRSESECQAGAHQTVLITPPFGIEPSYTT